MQVLRSIFCEASFRVEKTQAGFVIRIDMLIKKENDGNLASPTCNEHPILDLDYSNPDRAWAFLIDDNPQLSALLGSTSSLLHLCKWHLQLLKQDPPEWHSLL